MTTVTDLDPRAYVERLGQWRLRLDRARVLAADIRDSFRPGEAFGGLRDGWWNLGTVTRGLAASVLLRAAFRVADDAILLERRDPSSLVPRNVAVALGADALSYAALDDVEARYPDLYEGSADFIAGDPR